MLKKTLKHLKGFTLVELLVVIAIIAVLSSIGVVSFRGARQRANDGKMQADIRTIQSAVELYFANENQGPGKGATPNTFNALLAAINVTQGLTPNGAADAGPAYCYYEDNATPTTLSPVYIIAATGFSRDMGAIGYRATDPTLAAYGVHLSTPPGATLSTGVCTPSIPCSNTNYQTICFGN